MRAGVLFAFMAAVSMVLGLMRWPSVHWELARAWGAAAQGDRLVLAAVFDTSGTANTQSLTIKEQLQYGIRFFDLRVRAQKTVFRRTCRGPC